MKSSAPNFNENGSLNGAYKASLYKTLFNSRKALLSGYPGVKKGLALPDLKMKFGTATYTFKAGEEVDKIGASADGKEFQARYKKNAAKWDVVWKQKCKDMNVICKYEERGNSAPSWLVGGTYDINKLAKVDCKFNLYSRVVKKSLLLNMDDYVPGMKFGCDVKATPSDSSTAWKTDKWNVGMLYAHKFGSTAVGMNEKHVISCCHAYAIDKNTNFAIEAFKSGEEWPVVVGFGRKLDDNHTLKIRCNSAGQVQGKVEKKFGNLTIEMATCVDVHKKETMMALPAFGFKIAASG